MCSLSKLYALCHVIWRHVTWRRRHWMSRCDVMTSFESSGKNTDKEGMAWEGHQCSGIFIMCCHHSWSRSFHVYKSCKWTCIVQFLSNDHRISWWLFKIYRRNCCHECEGFLYLLWCFNKIVKIRDFLHGNSCNYGPDAKFKMTGCSNT